jgi:hypothetical protein
MKKTRIVSGLLAAVLVAAAFSGCGDASAKTSQSSDNSNTKQEQQGPQRERASIAKVVSMNGNQLTVILADMPERGGGMPPGNGTPSAIDDQQGGSPAQSDGKTPPDGSMPPGGGNGPAQTSGAAADGGSSAAGQGQPGHMGKGGGEITFDGDQVTYTLSDDVSVMKGTGDNAKEIDLSELAAGDVIRFATETDDSGNKVINSIVVME